MLGLKPIKLLPARERVASALRKAIIAQQIKEGETLTLETTAQQLEFPSHRCGRLSRFWRGTG